MKRYEFFLIKVSEALFVIVVAGFVAFGIVGLTHVLKSYKSNATTSLPASTINWRQIG